MIGWTPEVFWRATPWEVLNAIDGYNSANSPPKRGMSRADAEALAAEYPDSSSIKTRPGVVLLGGR